MEKEQFVDVVKNLRKMIKSGEHARCTCPKLKCEWYGNCYECVMIHRYHQDHIPNCLQPILENKVREIARVAEMVVAPKEKTPDEYWDYVNEVCSKKDNE